MESFVSRFGHFVWMWIAIHIQSDHCETNDYIPPVEVLFTTMTEQNLFYYNINFLHTVLFTFLKELIKIICLAVRRCLNW